MTQIIKNALIDRSIDEVYDFLFEPGNFILMPGIAEAKREGNTYLIKGEEKIPVIGLESVSYKVHIDSKKRPTYVSFHTEDYIAATKGVFELREQGEETSLQYTLDYKLPLSFFGKILDKLAMEKHMVDDVVEYLKNIQKALEKIETIMTHDVVTIQHPATASDVIKKMNDNNVRYLIVIDSNKLVGVITDGDVITKIYTEGVSQDAYIEDIMTTNVVTIAPNARIIDAINLMSAHKVRRLPVLKGETIVGLLSITDLDDYLGLFIKR
jgi:CBS domain-containing protein